MFGNRLKTKIHRLNLILKFIWHHPLASRNRVTAISRFVWWQVSQILYPRNVEIRFLEASKLLVSKGMEGATGNIYTGLVEFEDMCFLLHVLREEDIFADVGANVGVYTVLAAKNVGCSCFSFEPVLNSFGSLKKNIEINEIGARVALFQNGVGAEKACLSFTSDLNTVNHVISATEDAKANSVIVEVVTLDDVLRDNFPQLIKIDVEGFELNVLQGAEEILQSDSLKAIIIELNGSSSRYGVSDHQIHQKLISNGFYPFSYNPFSRSLKSLKTFGRFNTIYIKDFEWVLKRIETGRQFKIFRQAI